MKEKWVSIGAVVSAALASLCCLGPLVLVGLGLGGLGLAAGLVKYRPLFLGATAVLLAFAFYYTYRKREVHCADGSCRMDSAGRGAKALLWVVAVLALGLGTSHYWVGAFAPEKKSVSAGPGGQEVLLRLGGMHCISCAAAIQKALKEVPGVRDASVDFDGSEAQVIVAPGSVDPNDLVKTVEATGYQAALAGNKP